MNRETGVNGNFRWGPARKRTMLAWERSAHTKKAAPSRTRPYLLKVFAQEQVVEPSGLKWRCFGEWQLGGGKCGGLLGGRAIGPVVTIVTVVPPPLPGSGGNVMVGGGGGLYVGIKGGFIGGMSGMHD